MECWRSSVGLARESPTPFGLVPPNSSADRCFNSGPAPLHAGERSRAHSGLGRNLAQRLAAGGEVVVDVPSTAMDWVA